MPVAAAAPGTGVNGHGNGHAHVHADAGSTPRPPLPPRDPNTAEGEGDARRRRRRGPRREGDPANVNIAARQAGGAEGVPMHASAAGPGGMPASPATVSKESFLKRFARGVKSLVGPSKS